MSEPWKPVRQSSKYLLTRRPVYNMLAFNFGSQTVKNVAAHTHTHMHTCAHTHQGLIDALTKVIPDGEGSYGKGRRPEAPSVDPRLRSQ